MEKYLILPNVSDPLAHFDQFSWTSQIWQGMIIKHKIESYSESSARLDSCPCGVTDTRAKDDPSACQRTTSAL